MNILITGVGGPTPRSFGISLKKYSEYAPYKLFGTDVNQLSIGLYQHDLFDKTFVIPKATDQAYWATIERIIAENDIGFAVILPEVEVLEWSKKAEAGKLPCKVLLPSWSLAKLLIDKARMTEILKDLDIVPASIEFARDESDLDQVFRKLGVSFWVRSTSGTSGLGSLKIDSQASLKNWIQINPAVKMFLASQFLPGRNLACKMLYHNGKLLRSACAERVNYIMSKVAPSGITGNTSFGRLLNEPKLVHLASNAMDRLFQSTQSEKTGFFTVDFKEDDAGKPYITEINVRHVAFTQCFAAAGANFAEDTIRLLDGDESFSREFMMYEFERDLIFLRDVDSLPIIMKESQLLKQPAWDNDLQSTY